MKTIGSISDSRSPLNTIPIRVSTECMRAKLNPHYHDFTQICYSFAGTLTHVIDGREYTQTHGSCAIIPPFTIHSLDSMDSEETPVNIFITFRDEGFARFGYDWFAFHNLYTNFEGMKIPQYTHFRGKARQETDRIVRAMSNEFFKHSDMSREHIAHLLSQLLRTVCGAESPTQRIEVSDSARKRADAIRKAVRYISEHFREKISVDMLAEVASMPRRTFLRAFREITGVTTNEMLTSKRMNAAMLDVNFSDKSLSQIAEDFGLYDKSRFSKLFYEFYGMTPTEYRRVNHANSNRANFEYKRRFEWLGIEESGEDK